VPISIDSLRSASVRSRFVKSASTLNEARSLGLGSAFLCHSHLDAEAVKGIVTLFAEEGWRVYVDWQDTAMPETPTRGTAERIQAKIRELDYFVFLATQSSVTSRWCPWEIGYADREKTLDRILIVPTSDYSGNWYGNEYLQLYRKIDQTNEGKLGVWHPGQNLGVRLNAL
jgi:hypothetical protein